MHDYIQTNFVYKLNDSLGDMIRSLINYTTIINLIANLYLVIKGESLHSNSEIQGHTWAKTQYRVKIKEEVKSIIFSIYKRRNYKF